MDAEIIPCSNELSGLGNTVIVCVGGMVRAREQHIVRKGVI